MRGSPSGGRPDGTAGHGSHAPPRRSRQGVWLLAAACLLLLSAACCDAQAEVSPQQGLIRKVYWQAGVAVNSMPNFAKMTPVLTSVVPAIDYTCRAPNDRDCLGSYSDSTGVTFTGFLLAPASGSYRLYLNSDDGANLYLDNELTIANDGGPHPERERSMVVSMAAGYHPIHVEWYNQNLTAVLQLSWARNCGSSINATRQILGAPALWTSIPGAAAAAAPAVVEGLAMKAYWSGAAPFGFGNYGASTGQLVMQKTVYLMDCYPMSNCFGSYQTNVWAQFTGYILAPTDGTYTFHLRSDDGSRMSLAVAGSRLIDHSGFHTFYEKSNSTALPAGWHLITLDFFQGCCSGGVRLEWGGAGVPRQIVGNPYTRTSLPNSGASTASTLCLADAPSPPVVSGSTSGSSSSSGMSRGFTVSSSAESTAPPCQPGSFLAAAACQQCPLGFSCAGGSAAAEACPPGTFAAQPGAAACSKCEADWYQASFGQRSCSPCPEGSYAYFPGSSACIACFFGEPKVVAGRYASDAVVLNDPYTEQPFAGFRVVTLSAASPLASKASCGFNPLTSECTSLNSRVVALETFPSCEVRMYVLGDGGCSDTDTLVVVEGVYSNLDTVETPPDSTTPFNFKLAPAAAGLTLTFENKADGRKCSDSGLVGWSGGPCPAGTSLDINPQITDTPPVTVFKSSQCTPCDTGEACPAGTTQPCSPGTFNSIVGASSCPACPAGTVSDVGAEQCQECEAGTLPAPGKNYCQLCPAGQFSLLPGLGACSACPVGTYRNADAGGTECIKCPPGSFSAGGVGECILCAPGTATEKEGTTPDPITKGCPACAAGDFAQGLGSYTCNTCSAGEMSAARASSCTPCGGGRYTVNVDGKGATECLSCAKGTYRTATSSDNKCLSCPTGYATGLDGVGATSCKPCLKGYFASAPNTALCTPCAPGTFAKDPGSKICKVCPGGTATGLTPTAAPANASATLRLGSTAVAAVQCDNCPRRTFRPSMYSSNVCTPCPKGRETLLPTAATVCTSCPPGFTLLLTGVDWDLKCSACQEGTFGSRPGMSDVCPRCPLGSSVPDDGNTVCDICGPGTYQDTEGGAACKECREGTYNVLTGSTSAAACLLAPKGNYAAGTANDGFTPCEGGFYQDQEGQAGCKPCPPGYQCPAGSVAPKECPPGFFADLQQPFCKECQKGTYQELARQRACKTCPVGYFCPNTKMALPSACPPGTFGAKFMAVTRDVCTKCPINFITSTAGLSKCTKCPAGNWTGRFDGQSKCWSTSQKLNTSKSRRK